MDGSGEYYITVDTDKCDGCGDCAMACPEGILEIALDDYDEPKAAVKPGFAKTLADVCPGFHRKCSQKEPNCHSVCWQGAIEHSW